MKATSELLECIKDGLLMGASDSRALREGGIADSDITDAQTALAELRQRMEALEEYYAEMDTLDAAKAYVERQPRGRYLYYRNLLLYLADDTP